MAAAVLLVIRIDKIKFRKLGCKVIQKIEYLQNLTTFSIVKKSSFILFYFVLFSVCTNFVTIIKALIKQK